MRELPCRVRRLQFPAFAGIASVVEAFPAAPVHESKGEGGRSTQPRSRHECLFQHSSVDDLRRELDQAATAAASIRRRSRCDKPSSQSPHHLRHHHVPNGPQQAQFTAHMVTRSLRAGAPGQVLLDAGLDFAQE